MVRAIKSDRFVAGARIGDYRVDAEVAIDANAVVYLATHLVLPRQAYIKVPHPCSRPAAVQLLREACIHEALSHAGIPRVYECGILPDRRPWCAIELITGTTLKQLVSDGPLTLPDVIIVLRDLADLLDHAHERGVVHRRLTLGTIVHVQRRHTTYAIADWSDASTFDTDTGEAVDPKDDIHALGTIAFRALTGILPESLEGNLTVGTYCPSAPAELISLIERMLAEPAQRPAASEVCDRALGLCNTLAVAPPAHRPRWAPPQGFVADGGVAARAADEQAGFAARISRMRSR